MSLPTSKSILVTFAIMIVLVLFLTSEPVSANEKLVVPILFATERVLSADPSNLDYTNDQLPDHQLNYGVKNIVIDESPEHQEADRLSGLAWWSLLPNQTSGNPPQPTITLSRPDLIAKAKQIVLEGPKPRPLIVFVNGCCQPYKSSMETAAKIEATVQAPVLLYAWAALPPTEKKYRENELREKAGVEGFSDLLAELEAEIGADRIVLIAHSMGNRYLHETLLHRYWDHNKTIAYPKFRCVEFACADVNADEFASNEKEIAFNSLQTWITKNDFDPALALSEIQRGLYRRLGAPHGSLKKLVNTDGVNIIDIENLFKGKHDLPVSILADLIRKDEAGYAQRYTIFQMKAHLLKVQDER